MSTIGSVGGTGTELIQMLQRLAGQSDNDSEGFAARGSPPSGGPPPGGPPEGGASAITDKVGEFAESAGLDSETVTSLQDQLSSAISAALENADESTDPREVIDGAILSTLEEYDLDGEAFLSELKASAPAGGPRTGEMGGQLPSSDVSSQMLSLMNGGASSLSTSMSLVDTLA